MIAWASAKTIRNEVAEVTIQWLYRFAANHPEHARKMGDSCNCRLIYKTSAVLEALERGE